MADLQDLEDLPVKARYGTYNYFAPPAKAKEENNNQRSTTYKKKMPEKVKYCGLLMPVR